MLRYLTAGESHGQALVGIVEGLPAGLELRTEDLNLELARRQRGYGRGARMAIEHDVAEIISGVRKGKTLGSPIGLLIRNRDWENWKDEMAVEPGPVKRMVTKPRPGHADLAGAIKYGHQDIRNVLERASARETAMRVAIGTVARLLLTQFGIQVVSHVVEIGQTIVPHARLHGLSPKVLHERAEKSEVRCADGEAERAMIREITEAKKRGDTLGGVFEVAALGVPVGLGSYAQWDRRLDARLASALMSIQAIKGVEIGLGFEMARHQGSEVHDEILYDDRLRRFSRGTNNAGGLEGGVTNGEPVVARAAMKPLSTLRRPLRSVDLVTKAPHQATVERSDVCAVPPASVVGEAVVAWEVAGAFVEKFGGDSLAELRRHYESYLAYLEAL